ncbi:MAG: FG-GAP-like repeat-containing protein [Methanobacteriota archaeon]
MSVLTKWLALLCVSVMCVTAFQNVFAYEDDYEKQVDVFIDQNGYERKVWREKVNGVYQVFYDDNLHDNYTDISNNSVLDRLEIDTNRGVESEIIPISGDVYAVVYRSASNDGIIKTVGISPGGDISAAMIDWFKFETGICKVPDIVRAGDGVYAIAYSTICNDGKLVTLGIADNGSIAGPLVDSYVFDHGICNNPEIIPTADEVFAIAYEGANNDGYVKTIGIASNGTIATTGIDTMVYYTKNYNTPDIIPIGRSTFAIAFSDFNSKGYIQTYTISEEGNISNSAIDILEFDCLTGLTPDVSYVFDGVYAIAYTGPGNDGCLKTIRISADGCISDTVIDSYVFDTERGRFPEMIRVSGDIFAISYSGIDGDGYLKTVQVLSDGTISSPEGELLTFSTEECRSPDIIAIGRDVYAISYTDEGGVGAVVTLKINSEGVLLSHASVDVCQPQISMDVATGIMYVTWIQDEVNGIDELWYSGGNGSWATPRIGGAIPDSSVNALSLNMVVFNGKISITWSEGESINLMPDLDGDFIPDSIDDNILAFDISFGNDFSSDVVITNDTLGVTLAVDYTVESTTQPTVSLADNIPVGLECGIGHCFNISTTSVDSFEAVIKIRYNPNSLPVGVYEKYLCLYTYSETGWHVLGNKSAGEATSIDINNMYVWGRTNHFSIFAIAEATRNDCDIDGLNDAEEMNLDKAPYAAINTFSDGQATKRLTFDDCGNGETVFIDVPDYMASMDYLVDAKLQLSGVPAITQGWTNLVERSRLLAPGDGTCGDIETFDVDRDGDSDIVAVSQTRIDCYINAGNGVFNEPVSCQLDNIINNICLADIDTDGDYDIVASLNEGKFGWLQNNGDGVFSVLMLGQPGGGASLSAGTIDFNNDGNIDIICSMLGSKYGHGLLELFENDGAGQFSMVCALQTTGWYPILTSTNDFNSDGDSDIVVHDYMVDAVSYYENVGDGTFASPVDYMSGSSPFKGVNVDYDKDGDQDIVVCNVDRLSTDGFKSISLFANNGDGAFAPKVDYYLSCWPYDICSSDIDCDGYVDVVVSGQTGLDGRISIYRNIGRGFFEPELICIPALEGGTTKTVATLDVDNNGYPELVAANLEASSIFCYDAPLGYPDISIDIGDDGVSDCEIFPVKGSVTTPNLVVPMNEYLLSHPDLVVDEDWNISIPLVFHSERRGSIDIEYVSILLGAFDTNPVSDDTDFDGISDGVEFNINCVHPQTTDSFISDGIQTEDATLFFYSGESKVVFVTVPDNIVAMEYISEACLHIVDKTGGVSYLDIGDDGFNDFEIEEYHDGVFQEGLTNALNYILTISEDGADMGGEDGLIWIPLTLTATCSGIIELSDFSMRVEILTTNPVRSDTDGDGLSDGEELNVARRTTQTITELTYEGLPSPTPVISFHGNDLAMPTLNIPQADNSLEYVSGTKLEFQWVPDSTRITDNAPNDSVGLRQGITTDSQGISHIVWAHRTGEYPNYINTIYYKSGTGDAWSAVERLDGGDLDANPTYPVIATDSHDNIHVVWADTSNFMDSGNDIDVFHRCWNGMVWLPIERISTESEGNSVPSYWADNMVAMVIDENDGIHVAWVDNSNYAGSGTDCDIYYKQWNGLSWGTTMVVSTGSAISRYPSIAVDSMNVVHIAWNEFLQSVSDELFYRRLDGAMWSNTEWINNQIGFKGHCRNPTISITPDNNVHLFWGGIYINPLTGYQFGIIERTWNRIGWSPLNPVGKFDESRMPSIAIDKDGKIHLVWMGRTGTEWNYYYQMYGDNVWSEPEIICSESGTIGGMMSVDTCIDGRVVVIWCFSCGFDPINIHYKRFKYPLTLGVDIGSDESRSFVFDLDESTLFNIDMTNDIQHYIATQGDNIDENLFIPIKFTTMSYGHINIIDFSVTVDILITNPTTEYSDGDKLSDGEELSGWITDAIIEGYESPLEYMVISNPGMSDSDSDSIFDDEEKIIGSDPTKDDSDEDGLSDYEESVKGLDNYVTNPVNYNSDGDPCGDLADAFPVDPTEWVDTDFDGIGNNSDADDDNDGVLDIEDAFPWNPTGAEDTDGDGMPNVFLSVPWWFVETPLLEDLDDDNDGVPDHIVGLIRDAENNNNGIYDAGVEYDELPLFATEWLDTDKDGIGNNGDSDDDNDGVPDVEEDPPEFSRNPLESRNTDGDFKPDGITPLGDNEDQDDDNDGVLDDADAFSRNPRAWADTDGDGQPDEVYVEPFSNWYKPSPPMLVLDLDDDNDGVLDIQEKLEWRLNPTGAIDTDGDNKPDVAFSKPSWFSGTVLTADHDDDNDGHFDTSDAFPLDSTEWLDTDGDGTGNNADADDDGDGLLDCDEARYGTGVLIADSDRDGLMDGFEVKGWNVSIEFNNKLGIDNTYHIRSDPLRKNTDTDALNDYWEYQYKTDPGNADSDGDGLADGDELIDAFGGGWMVKGLDNDADGVKNGPTDWDSYGDGLSDKERFVIRGENGDAVVPFPAADYDKDYDRDGLTNIYEWTTDYRPGLVGVQGTSWLTPDTDSDGFWDGGPVTLPEVVRTVPVYSSTGTVFYIGSVKVAKHCSPETYRGENPDGDIVVDLAEGETDPLNHDMDLDGAPDGYDVDPITDLELTVKITEILALDKVDPDGSYAGDFYLKVFIDEMMYGQNKDDGRDNTKDPNGANWKNADGVTNWDDDAHKTPNEIGSRFTFPSSGLSDWVTNNPIEVIIVLYDDDQGHSPPDGDDVCDVGGAWPYASMWYDLKTGQWSGDDTLGDANGYGHVSGDEDGSWGTTYDEDDCDLWFDIKQNDNDDDGLTYWEEVKERQPGQPAYNTNPIEFTNIDIDGDGLDGNSERIYGTRPDIADSDGDRMSDLYEVNAIAGGLGWQDPAIYNGRYALIIGANTGPAYNYANIWNDIVRWYDLLIEDYSYQKRDIEVFYADGSAISTSNCYNSQWPADDDNNNDGIPDAAILVNEHQHMVDAPSSCAAITGAFIRLSNVMGPHDFLFTIVIGHSGDNQWGNCVIKLWGGDSGETIDEDEFAGSSYVGKLNNYERMVILMETCSSGRFIDELSSPKRIVYTSADSDEDAYGVNTVADSKWFFNYNFRNALVPLSGDITTGAISCNPSVDINGNGIISLYEAYICGESAAIAWQTPQRASPLFDTVSIDMFTYL